MRQLILTALLGIAVIACDDTASNHVDSPSTGLLGNPLEGIQKGGNFSSCHTRAYEEIGGPISLIDQTGERRTEADFKGKPSLVFFGFTYCPDVCPTTLVKISRALKRLEDTQRPQTILISVDSERDTPEELSRYLSLNAFPENTVGLTGNDEDIRSAANAFIADYTRVPQPDSAAEYTMDHTSLVYLMDENWKLKTFFNYTATDEDIANCLRELL